jgi:hypothetical protein
MIAATRTTHHTFNPYSDFSFEPSPKKKQKIKAIPTHAMPNRLTQPTTDNTGEKSLLFIGNL